MLGLLPFRLGFRGTVLALVLCWLTATAIFSYGIAVRVRTHAPVATYHADQVLEMLESALSESMPSESSVPTDTAALVDIWRAPGVAPMFLDHWCDGSRQFRANPYRDRETSHKELTRYLRQDLQQDLQGHHRKTCHWVVSELGAPRPMWGKPRWLRPFSLVPMVEGIQARFGAGVATLLPDDLWALGIAQGSLQTGLTEVRLGMDTNAALDAMAKELSTDRETLLREGAFIRSRVRRHSRAFEFPFQGRATGEPQPPLTPDRLEEAAVAGAEFLLRHQAEAGFFAYVYDGRNNRVDNDGYNLTRHAGSAYFLAQVAGIAGHAGALQGSRRALEWTYKHFAKPCGEHMCISSSDGTARLGETTLTALATAEFIHATILQNTPAPRRTKERLIGLMAFLQSQQRQDGELMHEYDLVNRAPIDVQHLYFSGQAALAFARAALTMEDQRQEYLAAANRIVTRLTQGGWDFFGNQYYFGEEHWTCLAAGELGPSMLPERVTRAREFCANWAEFARSYQYGPGVTPWRSEGLYGMGPIMVPRITPTSSRTEAFISTWDLEKHHGTDRDTAESIRRQIEAGLQGLLRYQWTPGPVHLFRDPAAAHGGMPGSPAELFSRNDYVQHACSAMIRWSQRLRE